MILQRLITMRNIIRSINALLAALNITILAIIVACVTWQVAARFIFTSPSIFTDELSRLLFICLGLFGGAYTAGQNRHLAIDLLPERKSPTSFIFVYSDYRYYLRNHHYGIWWWAINDGYIRFRSDLARFRLANGIYLYEHPD